MHHGDQHWRRHLSSSSQQLGQAVEPGGDFTRRVRPAQLRIGRQTCRGKHV
jgi:hypothetical protein